MVLLFTFELNGEQIEESLWESLSETSTSVVSRPQGKEKVAAENVIGTVFYKKDNLITSESG